MTYDVSAPSSVLLAPSIINPDYRTVYINVIFRHLLCLGHFHLNTIKVHPWLWRIPLDYLICIGRMIPNFLASVWLILVTLDVIPQALFSPASSHCTGKKTINSVFPRKIGALYPATSMRLRNSTHTCTPHIRGAWMALQGFDRASITRGQTTHQHVAAHT